MLEICNHDPMFTLHIAGLRVDNSKSVVVMCYDWLKFDNALKYGIVSQCIKICYSLVTPAKQQFNRKKLEQT